MACDGLFIKKGIFGCTEFAVNGSIRRNESTYLSTERTCLYLTGVLAAVVLDNAICDMISLTEFSIFNPYCGDQPLCVMPHQAVYLLP